ncbi:UDP-N-acetylmuramoyl-L-alanine--D-glutamate ligase [Altererythrobacter sp. KTW20L]|uniref:UDP-N-acetylmuramoyl-L-alanine--D-glutamate ligase n=1 Tax=Altererythrobacter sp. KTW20L TaxID=2942210 RepID=UPI0020C059D4|nr:UDP-N-acetylmuramoyl-L-alanine--D-glutamate ligase [Altererythrobacter sp. KTW20L]MCL6252155.1 UDP-N-acetylmuramoyl-L-alanine--D-glutamate ligase [Altererythrobacter sp. KTW20L]
MITSPAFSGKSYAVLGLARSGMAVVESLLASGAQVTAWDRQQIPRDKLAGRCTLADPMEIDLAGFDALVVSPGVPLNTHPLAGKARAAGVPIIGDIELFAQARASLPPHKVVGITGTNGKSTTTALVAHILKTAGVATLMGGNIGLPILAQEPLPAGGVYVLELSSYQIDLTHSLDCDVAVLLNITPDHLDRYADFAAYCRSKERLFLMQSDKNVAVIGEADREADEVAYRLEHDHGRLKNVVQFNNGAIGERQREWDTLQGPHNAQNAAAAIMVCEALCLSDEAIEQGLRTYPGLPHRMEVLGTFNGVLFINDSKATNAASTAPALAAWKPAPHKRVHWICGGLPKADNLDECLPHLGNVAAAYTIGEAGPLFASLLDGHCKVEQCEMLCTATARALEAAKPGDVVLFSPACASFDQFRDYEARGDSFREIVTGLTQDNRERLAK